MRIDWPEQFTFIGRTRPDGEAFSAGTLAAYAGDVAAILEREGVGPGDRVALWLDEGPDQLAAIFATWSRGAAFSVLPSYASRSGSDVSLDRVRGVLGVLTPRVLLHSDSFQLPEDTVAGVRCIALPGIGSTGTRTAPMPTRTGSADDTAFIQFTSGSTGGTAKGAVVSFRRLDANLSAIAERVSLTREDMMVSWAPLYHDMGLMAVLLPLSCGAGLTLMETAHFVRRPTSWLEAISRNGGTISTAPPTSLKLLTRRKPGDVDLSTWRYAWIGGEQVFADAIAAFEAAYAGAGLRPGVLQPTYGMAETVVGISCGAPFEQTEVRRDVISCGAPLSDMEVEVRAEDGTALPDDTEGRLFVRGPSVIRGYLGLEQRADEDWFDTGDQAFRHDGRLFITGRLKDIIKRGAETFPAAVIEDVAEKALGLKTGRAAAFATLRPDLGREEVVLLVEQRAWDDDTARTAAAAIASQIGLQVDVIRNVQGGKLPRTSSGKLMRQLAAIQYKEGKI